MVIDISERSAVSIVQEAEAAISEIVHEFKYNTLLYKYNFLEENGTILELSLGNIRKWACGVIATIGENLKSLWESIKKKFNNIKSRFKDWEDKRRAERIIKEFEQLDDEFVTTAENLKEFAKYIYEKAVSEQDIKDTVHQAEQASKKTTAKAKKVAIILDDNSYTIKS